MFHLVCEFADGTTHKVRYPSRESAQRALTFWLGLGTIARGWVQAAS